MNIKIQYSINFDAMKNYTYLYAIYVIYVSIDILCIYVVVFEYILNNKSLLSFTLIVKIVVDNLKNL